MRASSTSSKHLHRVKIERLVVIMSPINSKPRLIANPPVVRHFDEVCSTKHSNPEDCTRRRMSKVVLSEYEFLPRQQHEDPEPDQIDHRPPWNRFAERRPVRRLEGWNPGLVSWTDRRFEKSVAVDPILSDAWYIENENDYHFTTGDVFPQSKQAGVRESHSVVGH